MVKTTLYIPSTYLICENDAPLQYQKMFAASIKAQVERCDSGHSPMLSQPVQLVEAILKDIERDLGELEMK